MMTQTSALTFGVSTVSSNQTEGSSSLFPSTETRTEATLVQTSPEERKEKSENERKHRHRGQTAEQHREQSADENFYKPTATRLKHLRSPVPPHKQPNKDTDGQRHSLLRHV